MNAVRRHLQAFARIALMAMVTLVLLPTAAHAFASAQGGHAVTEVCTPQGMKLVVMGADSADSAAAPADAAKTANAALGHLDHCPFCASAATGWAPPPAVRTLALPAEGAAAAPLFLHAPRTLNVWVSAQPRGPPLPG